MFSNSNTNIAGIYKIENLITHNLYIGKAKNIRTRWNYHKSEGNKEKSNSNNHLYNALRKYGIDNFDFSIIEIIPLEQYNIISSERERYWIKYYNAYKDPNNYNETEGGEGRCGWIPSQEWRDNQSQRLKQWYQTQKGKEKAKKHSEQMKGENNPGYKKHSNGKKCLCIELNKTFKSTREAEQYIGVNHTGIALACREKTRTAGGYHWKYI